MSASWGAKTSAVQLTTIGVTEQFFNQTPTLKPGESIVVHVTIVFGDPAADSAIVSIYGTLDDSSEAWATVPLIDFQVDAVVGDTIEKEFPVSSEDAYKFRIGVRADGSTDPIVSADMDFRRDNVNL